MSNVYGISVVYKTWDSSPEIGRDWVCNNGELFDKWFIVTQTDDWVTIQLFNNIDNTELLFYPLTGTTNYMPEVGNLVVKSTPGGPVYKKFNIHKEKILFNKGGGIRAAQSYISNIANYNDKIIILDGDILLDKKKFSYVRGINLLDDTIYGCNRRDYTSYDDYVNNVGRDYGRNKCVDGYFQMYKHADGQYQYSHSYTAGGCDVMFTRLFDSTSLLDMDCHHIGYKGSDANFGATIDYKKQTVGWSGTG